MLNKEHVSLSFMGDYMPAFMDISGQRFGRLIALSQAPAVRGKIKWQVRCDCGAEKIVDGGHMRRGKIVSCGCYLHEITVEKAPRYLRKGAPTKHGMKGAKVYNVWKTMRQRCLNPKCADFKHYGGRGITVDPRWDDFRAFYADMGEPNGLTLERIDNAKGYGPDNCRWATWSDQVRNRRKL